MLYDQTTKKLLHIGKNCYENLFREVFSDSNIILFIPNINSVRVFINGIEERACFRNNEEWIVGDYEKEIGENLQSLINKTIDKGNSRIPEKYKDFDYTRVSFACKHDGEMIKSVEDALDERRFNVATSRSRSTTLIISDIPLTNMHSISPTVANFLRKCKSLDGININNHNDLVNIQNIIERNDIKSLYPGFEHIVDMLLDNDIQFSHDGDGDLLDNNGIVIATAGLLLKEHKIAIDPVDADSVSVFKSAGYKIIDSSTFNISMLN